MNSEISIVENTVHLCYPIVISASKKYLCALKRYLTAPKKYLCALKRYLTAPKKYLKQLWHMKMGILTDVGARKTGTFLCT